MLITVSLESIALTFLSKKRGRVSALAFVDLYAATHLVSL